jgi:hypothetical protein
VLTAWVFVLWRPQWGDALRSTQRHLHDAGQQVLLRLVQRKRTGRLARWLGIALWRGGDQALIDGAVVNGSAGLVGWIAGVTRHLQSGFLYSYAFWMIIGLAMLLGWFLTHIRRRSHRRATNRITLRRDLAADRGWPADAGVRRALMRARRAGWRC